MSEERTKREIERGAIIIRDLEAATSPPRGIPTETDLSDAVAALLIWYGELRVVAGVIPPGVPAAPPRRPRGGPPPAKKP